MARRSNSIMAQLPLPESLDAGRLASMYIDSETDLFVVLGPTASGKTRYAVELAHRLGLPAEIISADSRQVFRGMDIGTGKDLLEYGDVPYHLIDILDAGQKYSVYEFQKDFLLAYKDIRSRGAVPILCGGTGLYISSVTKGYDFRGSRPLSEAPCREEKLPGEFPQKPFFIGTLVSREERNSRIDARLSSRLEEGMLEEVRSLLESGVEPQTLISYGLEYKFVTLHLTGQLDYDQMRTLLGTAIHQFAKRQMTWFRGMERSGVQIHWVRV